MKGINVYLIVLAALALMVPQASPGSIRTEPRVAVSETISGVLEAVDGSALKGSVHYRAFAGASQTGVVPTGEGGAFSIEGLEVGHYLLTGKADGAGWTTQSSLVQAGGSDVSLKLTPACSYTGKIREALAKKTIGEERTVTVPKGELGVYAGACQRDPREEPGIDLEADHVVQVARGASIDLTAPDALEYKGYETSGQSSMIAIVLLKDATLLDAEKLTAAMKRAFPTALGSEGDERAQDAPPEPSRPRHSGRRYDRRCR